MISEIRMMSKWIANTDMSIGIGSHTRNPNTTSLPIPAGTILTWEDDAPNGNVWFHVELDGEKYRGKIECGRITNLINRGRISLSDNGNGFIIYDGEYLKKLLS